VRLSTRLGRAGGGASWLRSRAKSAFGPRGGLGGRGAVAAFAATSAKDARLSFLVWATLGQARPRAWSLTGAQDGGGTGGAGSGEGTTGLGARISGAAGGSRARILPFSKGRGVGVRIKEDSSGVSPGAITASSSSGRGEGRSGSEKRGVGGISMGSRGGLITVGGLGPMKLRKPSMALSRPRERTVAASGADAAQRAIEDARSILKAVGKGSSAILASRRETSLLSMPSAKISGGIGGRVGEGGINGSVKG